METYRAAVFMELYGHVDEDEENYHEVVLYEGEKFDIELEPDDEEVDLDLYITDEEDHVLYEDEDADPGAAVLFQPGQDAVYRFYVKAVDGDADYQLTIKERD